MSRNKESGRPRNLAARMGRWSAGHWKTATFGWLALVLVAFGLGMAGMKSIDENAPGPGESGRMDTILEAGFKQPAGESVLIQSRSLRAGEPAFRKAVADVVAGVSKIAAVQHVRNGEISKDGHAALDPVRHPRRQGQSGRQDRARRQEGRRRAARPSGLRHRRVRRRELPEGGRDGVRRRPREGRDAVASGHAHHPRAHVRHARRRGHPAAARADRGLRDLRAGRAHQQARAGGDGGARDGAADRARGRRRLLDVLLETRAPGARRRAQRARGTRSRRRHIRPLGADLRLHRHRRDGGHVPDRRLDLRVARPRHDPRRRRRGARLADGAARLALAARRQRRPPARPARRPAAPRRRRRADLGRDRRPRAARGPRSRQCSPPGCCSRWRRPRSSCTSPLRGPSRSRKSLEVIKTYDRMQQAFPGTALPANVVVKAPSVRAPAVQAAIGRLEQRAVASGRAFEPITVDVNKDATVANITDPDRRQRNRRRVESVVPRVARDDRARDRRRRSRTRKPASPGRRPNGRTSPAR